ncbi:hypothetical protein GN244_ATG02377 [Phytophthora infestans]|uniref:Uncharacterized protein n=1 Tax=Phytophthora infestans TaxID=4787 RepID=A0A833W766_PHYIN|nr:hypothetical protein GN244_ATG02377 [Phytophthora infestans]KAF4149999.1 hypothetical protein GN958_ATG00792 [Phytophthora infestans]KAI9985076.1 hypothetical protein PInf_004384 [Phytophthora infestans]
MAGPLPHEAPSPNIHGLSVRIHPRVVTQGGNDDGTAQRGARRDEQDIAAAEATSADVNLGTHRAGDPGSTARNDRGTHPGKCLQSGGGERQPGPSADAKATQDAVVNKSSGGDDGGVIEEAAIVVAEAQALRGRRRSSCEAPPHTFLHSRVHSDVIEYERRRKRNRGGRYMLEYLVAYMTVAGGPEEKQWLGVDVFKALLDAGKLEDEIGGDGE